MTFEELSAEINKRLKIDKSKIDQESAENPFHIQFYLDMWMRESRKLNKLEHQVKTIQLERMIFYKTKFEYKPDTQRELDAMMNADKQYQEAVSILTNQNLLVKYLSETIQNFRDRGWAIKNIISFIQFTEGTC
jgi:DNA helicase IV